MFHNKNIILILLSVVSATTGISLNKQATNTNASSSNWSILPGQGITLEDIEGGVKIENASGFGTRAYYNEKLTIDGLSFDWKVDNFSDGDGRGFAFHSEGDPFNYYTESPSCVFTAWQIYTQSRFRIGTDHDHRVKTTLNYADTEKTKNGFSNVDGHLIMNRSENYTLNFAFEKIDDTWYKVTINSTNVSIWGSPNYLPNASTYSVYTYITAEDLKVDADGQAYLITVAMAKNSDLSDAVYFLNMNYQTGLEASLDKTKYRINEDLDLSGLKVSKVFKNGNKVELDANKATISGYDKTVYGKQTVKVSALGYETSFDVEVLNPVTKVELSGTPKVDYEYGESLDLSTFKLIKTYENGDIEEIQVTESMVNDYNSDISGKQNISIIYGEYTIQVEVNVKEKYTALSFANDFLSLTNDACANTNENNATKLLPIWNQLKSSEYYQKLAIDEIEILINTTYSNDSTSAIELAMKRYDHIIERYGLENFITRPVSQYSNSIIKIASSDDNNTIAIIASISFVAISLIVGTFIIKRRKEEQ